MEKYEFDLGKSGGNPRFFPEGFVKEAFSKFSLEKEISESESFPNEIFSRIPFRARRAEFALTAGLFDPVSKILPFIPGKIGVIRPSPVSVEGSVGFSGLAEIETYLSGGASRLGAVIVRPDVSEPTGESLTMNERGWLVELARKHKFVIFEDGSGRDLSFLKNPLPPIKSLDEEGDSTIYVSDFSETLFPGLSLGIFCGPEAVVSRVRALSNPSVLDRHLCREWALSKGIESFRSEAVPEYKRRIELATELIESEFPQGVLLARPTGGFKLPLKIKDSGRALALARKEGVNFLTGTEFFPENPGAGNDLAILNVGGVPESSIVKGIRRIATSAFE